MGKYFAHTRRKIKQRTLHAPPIVAAAVVASEKELAVQRERTLLALERARAEKEARAHARVAKKRECADLDRSARQRTAARSAGFIIISGTGGLLTQEITIFRLSGVPAGGLWSAKIEFAIESGFTYYLNDPTTPAESDALHALRALAPCVAEQLLFGQAYADSADDNNRRTAFRLTESFMRKAYSVSSMNDDEARSLHHALLNDFETVALQRLRHFRATFDDIVAALMEKPKLSRRECQALLSPVYEGFEDHYRSRPKPQLFRPPHPQATQAHQSAAPALARA